MNISTQINNKPNNTAHKVDNLPMASKMPLANFGVGNNNELSKNSVFDSQLENLKNNNLTKNRTNKISKFSENEKAEFAKVARGFESMFINMVYKGLKSAMLEEKKSEMTFGADTLEGYTDMAFSDELSKKGNGIGIADMIYQNLTGDKLGNIRELDSKTYNKFISEMKPININEKPITIKETSSILDVEKDNSFVPDEGIGDEIAKNKVVKNNLSSKLEERLSNYDEFIKEASEKYSVPVNLIKSVISAESFGKSDAVSKVGAKGLMQLMDGTSKDLGVKDPFNPKDNIIGGTKYLRLMMDKFDGNLENVLSAYNAGPGNVVKHNGVPPFQETKSYINRVKHYLELYSNDKPETSNVNSNSINPNNINSNSAEKDKLELLKALQNNYSNPNKNVDEFIF